MSQNVDLFIEIEAQKYAALIDGFLDSLQQANKTAVMSEALIAARREYFEVAVSKGVDFLQISFETLSRLSAEDLMTAAKELPDKLSQSSREDFAQAAARRTDAARWDKSFPEGQNDLVFDLSVSAKSVDDRLAEYLKNYNGPKESEGPHDKEIRRDPETPALLQIYNAPAGKWNTWKKLGKFLEERCAWDLLDDFQLENSRKGGQAKSVGKYAVLNEFVNRGEPTWHTGHVSGDMYDPATLMVVISRDPQKIGEMSNGQHWSSCMGENGVNAHFVPKDIEAGSLVAYLVSKDDPQARYPLMRQLLKPHLNDQGEMVLVPSKVYGGGSSGNSRTREALNEVLSDFCRHVNAGKTGAFKMDPRLYGDGQTGVVMLGAEWDDKTIQQGVIKFFDSSFQEWMVELRTRERGIHYTSQQLKQAREYKEDPDTLAEWNATLQQHQTEANTYTKYLRSLQNPNMLAKRFYRQTRRESLDSVPDPIACLKHAQSPIVTQRAKAVDAAVEKGDTTLLTAYMKDLDSESHAQIACLVFPFLGENDAAKGQLAKNWAEQTKELFPLKARLSNCRYVAGTMSLDNELQCAAADVWSAQLANLAPASRLEEIEAFMTAYVKYGTYTNRIGLQAYIASVGEIDDPDRRDELLRKADIWTNGGELKESLAATIAANAKNRGGIADRINSDFYAYHLAQERQTKDGAWDDIKTSITSLPTAEEKIKQYFALIDLSPMAQKSQDLLPTVMTEAKALEDVTRRGVYQQMLARATDRTLIDQIMVQAEAVIAPVQDLDQKIFAYLNMASETTYAEDKDALIEKALGFIKDSATGEKRLDYPLRALSGLPFSSPAREKILSFLLEDAPSLSPESRLKSHLLVLDQAGSFSAYREQALTALWTDLKETDRLTRLQILTRNVAQYIPDGSLLRGDFVQLLGQDLKLLPSDPIMHADHVKGHIDVYERILGGLFEKDLNRIALEGLLQDLGRLPQAAQRTTVAERALSKARDFPDLLPKAESIYEKQVKIQRLMRNDMNRGHTLSDAEKTQEAQVWQQAVRSFDRVTWRIAAASEIGSTFYHPHPIRIEAARILLDDLKNLTTDAQKTEVGLRALSLTDKGSAEQNKAIDLLDRCAQAYTDPVEKAKVYRHILQYDPDDAAIKGRMISGLSAGIPYFPEVNDQLDALGFLIKKTDPGSSAQKQAVQDALSKMKEGTLSWQGVAVCRAIILSLSDSESEKAQAAHHLIRHAKEQSDTHDKIENFKLIMDHTAPASAASLEAVRTSLDCLAQDNPSKIYLAHAHRSVFLSESDPSLQARALEEWKKQVMKEPFASSRCAEAQNLLNEASTDSVRLAAVGLLIDEGAQLGNMAQAEVMTHILPYSQKIDAIDSKLAERLPKFLANEESWNRIERLRGWMKGMGKISQQKGVELLLSYADHEFDAWRRFNAARDALWYAKPGSEAVQRAKAIMRENDYRLRKRDRLRFLYHRIATGNQASDPIADATQDSARYKPKERSKDKGGRGRMKTRDHALK